MANSVITAIERDPKRKQRYRIFIDGLFAFTVHEDVLIKHRLIKGETVDESKLEEALRDEERHSAYLKALRWLGVRQRAEKELRAYLKKNKYEQEVIDEAVARAKEQGYIDDERFSQTLAQERLASHGKGKQWIKRELLHKGVNREIVSGALSEIDSSTELQSATNLARKRWRTLSGKEDQRDASRKLAAYLARRGYSMEVVRNAVRAAVSENIEEIDDIASESELWLE